MRPRGSSRMKGTPLPFTFWSPCLALPKGHSLASPNHASCPICSYSLQHPDLPFSFSFSFLFSTASPHPFSYIFSSSRHHYSPSLPSFGGSGFSSQSRTEPSPPTPLCPVSLEHLDWPCRMSSGCNPASSRGCFARGRISLSLFLSVLECLHISHSSLVFFRFFSFSHCFF